MNPRRIAAVVAAIVAVTARAHAGDAPAWLEQASRLPASPIESGADAVVLLDERNVTVADDGRITTRRTYNESRARVLIAPSGAVTPGVVFGAETEVVERTVFTQFDWALQEESPVRLVRRTLTLPAGWEVRSLTFNHAPIDAVRTGSSFAWELRDLAATPAEPASPPFSSLVPRLAVTFMPIRTSPVRRDAV